MWHTQKVLGYLSLISVRGGLCTSGIQAQRTATYPKGHTSPVSTNKLMGLLALRLLYSIFLLEHLWYSNKNLEFLSLIFVKRAVHFLYTSTKDSHMPRVSHKLSQFKQADGIACIDFVLLIFPSRILVARTK